MAKKKSFAEHAIAHPTVAHSFGMTAHPKHLDKYEVEDAARHLEKHQEIKADRKLHRAAINHLKKKKKMIEKATKEK